MGHRDRMRVRAVVRTIPKNPSTPRRVSETTQGVEQLETGQLIRQKLWTRRLPVRQARQTILSCRGSHRYGLRSSPVVADDLRMHLAPALWIGIGVVVLVIGAVLLFFRGSSPEDLGAVSDQWVAQHRAGQVDDLSR